MGYHCDFLPLLDAKVAQNLLYLHLSFLAFFNATKTLSSTLVLFCLGPCLQEKMEAIALLSATSSLRTFFYSGGSDEGGSFYFFRPFPWHEL